MKIVSQFISLSLTLWLVLSCAEEQTEDFISFDNGESHFIEFGTECGWCAGQEFIKITESEVEYTRVIPCGDKMGTSTNNRQLNILEWEQLISTFNTDNFIKLDYNTCNVCVDGCDEIIRIGNADTLYQIRYNPGQDIEGLETLLEKLTNLMQEFTEDN